jgi:hypothetical protein
MYGTPVLRFGFLANFLLSFGCVQKRMFESQRGKQRNNRFVKSISIQHGCSLMNFQPQSSRPFLKITVTLPKHVAPCRGAHPSPTHCYLLLIQRLLEERIPFHFLKCLLDTFTDPKLQ